MRHIAVYISSHGYGHLTRCLAVIGSLLEENNRITVKCSPDHIDFANHYFEEINLTELVEKNLRYDSMRTDIGTLVKAGSMEIDIEASLQQAKEFVASWDNRLLYEKTYYGEDKPDLIVGDIVPWSFLYAKEAGIPSVAISNFTWLDTCKHFLPQDLYDQYEAAYKLADYCLAYELSMPSMYETFSSTKQISLVMRKTNAEEALRIRAQYSRPMVYVSIGGLVGISEVIPVEGLPYDFVCTSGVKMSGSNVHQLPVNASTQNYMAAADFVITKPGWSTVAEALYCNKPLGLIDRPDSYEDRSTMAYLLERNQCVKIAQSDLQDMAQIMSHLEALKGLRGTYPYHDSLEEITSYFNQIIDQALE